jgi:adenylate cyclase
LPLPDKPSIAVLPFENMSSDPEQEFFADGIAEDLITALSRYPSLFVIARNSSFTYKGHAVDVKRIGRELEGSLRKSGSRIRVTAQLVEAETGKHIWAERYDREVADTFALQDEITEAVTMVVAPAIADAELHRAVRKPPGSIDAWGAFQRGLWHVSSFSLADNAEAQKWFRQSIDLDPNFAGGYWGLARAQFHAAAGLLSGDLVGAQRSAETLARRAVALDGADAEARSALAFTLLMRGDHQGAMVETELVLTLCPNLALAYGEKGAILIFSGRPREGLAALQTCVRLNPHDPLLRVRLLHVATGLYLARDYEAAIEAAKKAILSYPDFPWPYRWLAASLGQLGRAEEAKEALEKAIAILPTLFQRRIVRHRVSWMRPEDHAHMLEGLRKAGWREE